MKKAIRCIAFMVILGFIVLKIYDVLKWKDTAGDYISTTQQLYATEEGLIDVVFLGSSHGYCGTSADVMWGEYGYSAFGMNTSGQDKDSTYYMLKEVLKTQSPRVVCVELWGLTYDEHAILGNVYRNMLSLQLSRNSVELVKAYVEDEEEQKDYILRWPIIHTRYKELDKYDFVTNDVSEYGRSVPGFYTAGWSAYPTEAMECKVAGELTESNEAWLNALYQLSQEEDFELVLYVAPTDIKVEYQQQMNAAGEFAREKGITFFDFNRLAPDIGIDYSSDFSDGTHLNSRGAKKLTLYLGDYFDKNFDLMDHRGEDQYAFWEQSYQYYEQLEPAYIMSQTKDLGEYITLLKEMRNITCVIALEGNYKESGLNFQEAFGELGMTEEDYEAGGKFIYTDGELQKVLENDSKDIYVYELNEFDSFKIWNAQLYDSEATNHNNIMLNLDSVGSIYDGVSVVVYDDIRKIMIDKRGYF